jgi:predicted RNA-binding protein with PIN domain
MHYFLDGYNLLFRVDKEKRSLQKKREYVLSVLYEEMQGSKLSLTIVFDSMNTDEESRRGHKGPIEIVYTAKKQTADQYIIDEILHCKNPKVETVVTSDTQLAMQCRCCGANTMTVEDFLLFLTKKQKKVVEKSKIAFKETSYNMKRLLEIFEKKLFDEEL